MEYFHQPEPKNILTLPITGALIYSDPSYRLPYFILFLLMIIIGLINNIFSLMTFLRARIRRSISGIYLIVYTLCSTILMILILTNLISIFYYDNCHVRLWMCHGHPYLSSVMVYTCILISATIAIEEVLNKQFNLDKYRSRRQAVIVSLTIFILVCGSHLEKIVNRRLIEHPSGDYYCTYEEPLYHLSNQVFVYIYLILPCLIHLICLISIFSIQSEKRLLEKIFFLKNHFIPSIFIILCLISNSFYRYFSPYSIGIHVLFLCLFYAPQLFTYMIYVYPNNFYVKEFYQMWIHKKLCCCFYHQERHVEEFGIIDKLWIRRTSLETTKTIYNLNDICSESEFYRKNNF